MKKFIKNISVAGVVVASSIGLAACGEEKIPAPLFKGYNDIYVVDDVFSLDGTYLRIWTTKTEYYDVPITDEMLLQAPNMATPGEKLITIEYGGLEYTYTINVLTLDSSAITGIKSEYEVNDTLSFANVKLKLTYTNGQTKTIALTSDNLVNPIDMSTAGPKLAQFRYNGTVYGFSFKVVDSYAEMVDKLSTFLNQYSMGNNIGSVNAYADYSLVAKYLGDTAEYNGHLGDLQFDQSITNGDRMLDNLYRIVLGGYVNSSANINNISITSTSQMMVKLEIAKTLNEIVNNLKRVNYIDYIVNDMLLSQPDSYYISTLTDKISAKLNITSKKGVSTVESFVTKYYYKFSNLEQIDLSGCTAELYDLFWSYSNDVDAIAEQICDKLYIRGNDGLDAVVNLLRANFAKADDLQNVDFTAVLKDLYNVVASYSSLIKDLSTRLADALLIKSEQGYEESLALCQKYLGTWQDVKALDCKALASDIYSLAMEYNPLIDMLSYHLCTYLGIKDEPGEQAILDFCNEHLASIQAIESIDAEECVKELYNIFKQYTITNSDAIEMVERMISEITTFDADSITNLFNILADYILPYQLGDKLADPSLCGSLENDAQAMAIKDLYFNSIADMIGAVVTYSQDLDFEKAYSTLKTALSNCSQVIAECNEKQIAFKFVFEDVTQDDLQYTSIEWPDYTPYADLVLDTLNEIYTKGLTAYLEESQLLDMAYTGFIDYLFDGNDLSSLMLVHDVHEYDECFSEIVAKQDEYSNNDYVVFTDENGTYLAGTISNWAEHLVYTLQYDEDAGNYSWKTVTVQSEDIVGKCVSRFGSESDIALKSSVAYVILTYFPNFDFNVVYKYLYPALNGHKFDFAQFITEIKGEELSVEQFIIDFCNMVGYDVTEYVDQFKQTGKTTLLEDLASQYLYIKHEDAEDINNAVMDLAKYLDEITVNGFVFEEFATKLNTFADLMLSYIKDNDLDYNEFFGVLMIIDNLYDVYQKGFVNYLIDKQVIENLFDAYLIALYETTDLTDLEAWRVFDPITSDSSTAIVKSESEYYRYDTVLVRTMTSAGPCICTIEDIDYYGDKIIFRSYENVEFEMSAIIGRVVHVNAGNNNFDQVIFDLVKNNPKFDISKVAEYVYKLMKNEQVDVEQFVIDVCDMLDIKEAKYIKNYVEYGTLFLLRDYVTNLFEDYHFGTEELKDACADLAEYLDLAIVNGVDFADLLAKVNSCIVEAKNYAQQNPACSEYDIILLGLLETITNPAEDVDAYLHDVASEYSYQIKDYMQITLASMLNIDGDTKAFAELRPIVVKYVDAMVDGTFDKAEFAKDLLTYINTYCDEDIKVTLNAVSSLIAYLYVANGQEAIDFNELFAFIKLPDGFNVDFNVLINKLLDQNSYNVFEFGDVEVQFVTDTQGNIIKEISTLTISVDFDMMVTALNGEITLTLEVEF